MQFTFSTGGYSQGEFIVKKRWNTLYIYDTEMLDDEIPPFRDENIHLKAKIPLKSNSGWPALVRYLEKVKWEDTYFNQSVMDGTQWKLLYRSETNKIKTFGSNAYPKGYGLFEKKLRAVLKAGGYDPGTRIGYGEEPWDFTLE